MSDELPNPPDDIPLSADNLLVPPNTDSPLVLIEWLAKLDTGLRLQHAETLMQLVRTRPAMEQEALLHVIKDQLGFQVGTMRERLKVLDKAQGARFRAVPSHVGKSKAGRRYLAEMVYRPEGSPPFGFLVYWLDDPDPADSPEFYEKVADGEVEIRPLATRLAASGAVLLPSSYEEYGDDASLLARLRSFFGKYVQIESPGVLDLAAAYVMYSWQQDKFPIAAYFRLEGDFAAGKTTFLRAFAHVCYRSTLAGGAANAAPIFRVVDSLRGTLILDEADFDTKDQEWKQTLKVLNQGWAKGNPVLRAERAGDGEPFDVHAYDPFGAKVLASRRPFPDAALESRCLSTTMVPPIQLRADIPLFPDRAFFQEAESLRNQLLLWRFRTHPHIQADPRERIEGVEPRLTANGLIVLSAIQDPQVRATIEQRLRELSDEVRQARSDSFEGLVALAVLRAWMRAGQPRDHFDLQVATDEMQPTQRVSAKKMGELVRKVLGLKTRRVGGLARVVASPAELHALATRYAVDLDGLGYRPPRQPVR